MSFDLQKYIERAAQFEPAASQTPWEITSDAPNVVRSQLGACSGDDWVDVGEGKAHKTATISEHAIIEGPVLIGSYCQIGPGAFLRDGVWLEKGVTIGSHAEIKASFVFAGSRVAHLNYVGNSFIGEDVNLEAGAVIANHWNERDGEPIFLRTPNGDRLPTGVAKFGAILGDGVRVGANAVTSPGTVLARKAVVDRLELVR